MFFVTHRYAFADRFRRQHAPATLFLRAERQPDGRRNYKLAVKDPLPTSYGEDLYYQLGGWLDEDKRYIASATATPNGGTEAASVGPRAGETAATSPGTPGSG